MTYKLTNVTVESKSDTEWEIAFHFGNIYLAVWFYKDMGIKAIVQQLMALIGNLIQNYSNMN